MSFEEYYQKVLEEDKLEWMEEGDIIDEFSTFYVIANIKEKYVYTRPIPPREAIWWEWQNLPPDEE